MLSVEYISSMFAMFTTSHTHELLLRELNATCSVCVRLVEQMKKKTLRVQWQWTNKHRTLHGNIWDNKVMILSCICSASWWFFSPACLSFSIVLDSDLIDATHFYGIITHIAQTTARWQHSSVFWKTARNEAGRTSNHIRNGSHIKAESQNITDLCTRNYIWQMSGRVWLMCYISLGRPTWTTLNCPNV